MSRLTLIVAATIFNGIGRNAGLPWRLPQEMAYFARVTSNAPEGTANAVVMGRNTWESIPLKFRPLKNRINVVISRNESYALEHTKSVTTPPVKFSTDLNAALVQLSGKELEGHSLYRSFIIGGASLYQETLSLPPSSIVFVDRILITRIISPAFDDCDVFMPNFLDEANATDGHSAWTRASHAELANWVGFDVPEGIQEEKGVQYEFQMWIR
ncbi:hypothetical protein PHLCEN_2v473 [Hermanssonia centrifuga]|uniref:Dihydrofolate reductase n=1 Tax=Hermanssonia centrifuga TaxID=98765 RepID=A0A2R6S614_9APHY|nr:hypothetical protein PHLCEN_2v473 [Hermanssonia centrifuga]